jgi:hypothetical protein
MGTADDPMVVLDSQARVQGVQGLRVVDASAFPLLPPGHPQSAVCEWAFSFPSPFFFFLFFLSPFLWIWVHVWER